MRSSSIRAASALCALVPFALSASAARGDDAAATQPPRSSALLDAAPAPDASSQRRGGDLLVPRLGAFESHREGDGGGGGMRHGSGLREEERIGVYGQPEWTRHRRFGFSDVYVLDCSQIELEQWYRGRFADEQGPRHGGRTELTFGLPPRLQLGVAINYERVTGGLGLDTEDDEEDGDDDVEAEDDLEDLDIDHDSVDVEVRWAFADWGRIPTNPTLGVGWRFNDGEKDELVGKLIFSDEIAPRWHWTANLVAQQRVGGDRRLEVDATGGISYTIVDQSLSLGAEAVWIRVHNKHTRDDADHQILAGPSLQWRPSRRTHLNVTPLAGLGHRDQDWTVFVVFGIDIGPEPERIPTYR